MDPSDPAYQGQRDYSLLLLRLYDPLVLGVAARWVWHCPLQRLTDHYRWHIRPNHLDVGPGTGYFLAHAGLPSGSNVTLLDPNLDVLRHAAAQLDGLEVSAVEADVLKPLPVDGPYASAAMSLVLHCLPGPMLRKSTAIRNVAAVLAPDGVLFGSTVLGDEADHSWAARRMLSAYNGRGAFDNRTDTVAGLRDILESSFEHVEVDVVGSIATFLAVAPRAVSAPGDEAPAA